MSGDRRPPTLWFAVVVLTIVPLLGGCGGGSEVSRTGASRSSATVRPRPAPGPVGVWLDDQFPDLYTYMALREDGSVVMAMLDPATDPTDPSVVRQAMERAEGTGRWRTDGDRVEIKAALLPGADEYAEEVSATVSGDQLTVALEDGSTTSYQRI